MEIEDEDIITVTFNSTALASATYDRAAQELTVVFRNGRSADYSGVPVLVFLGLARASSAGLYYDTKIKGRY